MEFFKKHKEKLEVVLIVVLLGVALGVGSPIVITNINNAQNQAVKLESKANAKEAWQVEFDNGNIEEDEVFEWNDGTYYWIVDDEGNVQEKK